MTDRLILPSSNPGYFSLKQCVYSSIANEHQINNFPGVDYHAYLGRDLHRDTIINNLHKLFKQCINPLKNKHSGLRLTCVYRNKKVNELIEGVPYSQHIYGYAADVVVPNMRTSKIFNWCRLHLPAYHQLIWEYPERGNYFTGQNAFSWIHISYIEGNNFKENSVSSLESKIHDYYKKDYTYKINNFTHGIKKAYGNLINLNDE